MAKERVCLAYSGGLDTSCILAWLIEKGYEVVCFLCDVGQVEDFKAAERKALKIGAEKLVVEDLRREFIEELCFTSIQCNAIWEDRYLLGTSLARPVIARAQMRVAQRERCVAVSHGCTGKGNDQVRFELAFYAIQPSIRVIAPWRDPVFYERFAGRNDLLDYAGKMGIEVTSTKAKPWSMDENLAHCSYEAGILEDADQTPPDDMWKMTVDPRDAPDQAEEFSVEFTKGVPTKLTWTKGGKMTTVTNPVDLFLAMNEIGHRHGVGRIDIVENRFIGLKSRGCYDTPGLTILRLAHVDLEGLVLDREVRSWRDTSITAPWSKLIYNGQYFSPEMALLNACIPHTQTDVNGTVRMRAYKGNCYTIGRSSPTSKLYDAEMASMDSMTDFEPTATSGFIEIQAIRLKKYGQAMEERGQGLSGL